MRVGFVGWRGMVGSVLLSRMQEERDFDLIEPVFFSTSAAGGTGPAVGRHAPGEARAMRTTRRVQGPGCDRHLPGRRLDRADVPEAPRRGLRRLLDRCRLDAAHEGRRGHHPRPGQSRRDRRRAREGREELRRRQLHREPDDDGHGGAAAREPGRVDDLHDLPGGVGGRRAEHARAAAADGRGAPRREGAARRPATRRSSTSTARSRGSCATRASPPSTSACRSPAA